MKKILAVLMMLSLIFAFAGCAKDEPGKDVYDADGTGTTDTETTEKQVLKIGVDDTYAPMEYRDPETNELIGFDVDFAKAVAEYMGMDIEYVPTGWDGIFLGLKSDKYDCIISSVSLTPDRMEQYGFSKPYLSNGQVIVVQKGDTSVKTPEDLKGKEVGVQIQTTADIAAQKHQETVDFNLTQYDDIIQTFADLKTGRLDCIVVDYAVALDYTAKNPDDFEITSAQLTNEPIAVCINKDNTELIDKFNEAITALQESGKLKEISMEWFNEDYTSNIDEELR